MSQIALDLCVGCLLCLGVLGIGFIAGWRCKHSPNQAAIATWQLKPLALRGRPVCFSELLSHWHDMRPRLAELAEGVRRLRDAPETAVVEWRGDLVRVTRELRLALKSILPGDQSVALRGKARNFRRQPNNHDQEVLTNDHIETLLAERETLEKHEREGNANGNGSSPGRHRFSTKQVVAPLPNDGGLPATVFEVQCHDVSARDIRYFLDDFPTTDRVLIGLGLPAPVKWIVAEIESYRNVFMYGRTGYLVTARFVATVNGSHQPHVEEAGALAAG